MMSCCGRQAGEQAQVPQRRQARETASQAAPAAVNRGPEAATAGGVPLRLQFTGTRALALPVCARRILVQPGQVLHDLPDAERAALWRTGLFR